MFKPLNRPGAPLVLAGLLALVALAGPVQAQDAARMNRLVRASADADAFRQSDGGEVTFIRSASGAVTGLMIHQDGRDKIALKQ